jgi:hypothetical protein
MRKPQSKRRKLYQQHLPPAPTDISDQFEAHGVGSRECAEGVTVLKRIGNWSVLKISGADCGYTVGWIPDETCVPLLWDVEAAVVDIAWTLQQCGVEGRSGDLVMYAINNITRYRSGGMLVGAKRTSRLEDMSHIQLCIKREMPNGTQKQIVVCGDEEFEIVPKPLRRSNNAKTSRQ